MKERVLSSKRVFEGEILKLRVDEIEAADGHRGSREVIEHRGAVGVVCVDGGEVVLVRQYRHATGEELLEIPAGKLDEGEDPEECARRELTEEVGLRARSISHLATYYTTPGFTDELFHLFFTDEVDEADAGTDPGEVLKVERHPATDVHRLLTSGAVRDAKTLLGLAFLALRA